MVFQVDINDGSGVEVGVIVGVFVKVGVMVKVGVIVGVFVKVGVGVGVIKSHSIILNLSQPSKVITLIPTDGEVSN